VSEGSPSVRDESTMVISDSHGDIIPGERNGFFAEDTLHRGPGTTVAVVIAQAGYELHTWARRRSSLDTLGPTPYVTLQGTDQSG
jgi:hypothetical protein